MVTSKYGGLPRSRFHWDGFVETFIGEQACSRQGRDSVFVRSGTGTAPSQRQPGRYFTITHPFHPWRGRRYEVLEHRREWGQWRVYYLTKTARRGFFPAAWTDLGPADPFVEQARGRAIARVEDLLELTQLVSGSVNEIKPRM